MADPPRVCVDADVLVDFLTDAPGYPERLDGARWLLEDAVERGTVKLVLPASVIAETCGNRAMRPQAARDREVRAERVQRFLKWVRDSRALVVDIDQRVAERAVELAQEHELKGGDAMVLAAALTAGCLVLYTWDNGLLKTNGREGISPMLVVGPQRQLPPQTEIDVHETTRNAGGR
ncbi:type II toxin-antitoxin system VapC family toxin [Blastococcus sp. SYSU DS1021]